MTTTPLDGDESKSVLIRCALTAHNHHDLREIVLNHDDYMALQTDPDILPYVHHEDGWKIKFFGLPVVCVS